MGSRMEGENVEVVKVNLSTVPYHACDTAVGRTGHEDWLWT